MKGVAACAGEGKSWTSHLQHPRPPHDAPVPAACPAVLTATGPKGRAHVPVTPDHTSAAPQEAPYPLWEHAAFFCLFQEREGKRSSLSGVCIAHTPSYSEHHFSLTEFLTPLMRHAIKKNGEGQRSVPPTGTSTVLRSLSRKNKNSTFVQDDPHFFLKKCMKL